MISVTGVQALPQDREATSAERLPSRWRVGDVVDRRFRLAGPLGDGGMSEVWSAWDGRSARVVALKLPAGPAFVVACAGLRNEARVLRRARHPHLVKLLAAGVAGPWPYLALEPLRPRTLGDRVAREGPLAPRDVAAALAPVARALDALHRAGVAHRDVKAANVLFDAAGRAVLCDLGLARAEGAAGAARHERASVGTPGYMAPEVLRGEARSHDAWRAADQFALAVTAHHALTGHGPGGGAEALGATRRAGALDAVLQRATARDPRARFPTAGAFGEALAAACAAPLQAAS